MWPGLCSPTKAPVGWGPAFTQGTLDSLGAPTGSGLCPWSRPPGWLWALCRPAHLPASPGCRRVGCAMSSVLRSRDPSTCGRDTSALFFPQAGEKHYHPLCALCVRCGRMFAEGEEMYLQGEIKNVLLSPLGQEMDISGAHTMYWV